MLEVVVQRFEEALLVGGAPSATRFRPGLSETEAAGLKYWGPELVTLYRWHDGVEAAEEVLRPSEDTELCYVMPGLDVADGLWWMPAQLARVRHVERRLSPQEWLLMDGQYEYVTYSRTREVVAGCPEDGLQTRFPSLESFFGFVADAWEAGIFAWQRSDEEDFGGLFECDRPWLEVLIEAKPEIVREAGREFR